MKTSESYRNICATGRKEVRSIYISLSRCLPRSCSRSQSTVHPRSACFIFKIRRLPFSKLMLSLLKTTLCKLLCISDVHFHLYISLMDHDGNFLSVFFGLFSCFYVSPRTGRLREFWRTMVFYPYKEPLSSLWLTHNDKLKTWGCYTQAQTPRLLSVLLP